MGESNNVSDISILLNILILLCIMECIAGTILKLFASENLVQKNAIHSLVTKEVVRKDAPDNERKEGRCGGTDRLKI